MTKNITYLYLSKIHKGQLKFRLKKKVFLLFQADDLESLFVEKKAFSSIFASSSWTIVGNLKKNVVLWLDDATENNVLVRQKKQKTNPKLINDYQK